MLPDLSVFSSSEDVLGGGLAEGSWVVIFFCVGWLLAATSLFQPLAKKDTPKPIAETCTATTGQDEEALWTPVTKSQASPRASISSRQSDRAAFDILERYGVFGATPGSWSTSCENEPSA
eukprot:TRINITY_DN103661_c0_g1_i1.p2 TRINITY_DN103661_c0_g1~~TRINITY_DN103661_c0_g1_i1.p2  ORF type:complete len:120 (-),score=28.23 TRINITY_DN103661_c0_g1_i1:204-563(-)